MSDQSKIQFRQMLAKLSSLIKPSELETMKYMCMDMIPRAFLEEIDSAVKLWVALEERDDLSPDNTVFLNTLLASGCPGRVDVLTVLEQYNETASTWKMQDLHKEMDMISQNLGREWRPLARALGLTEMDIDQISHRHSTDLQEQIRQALSLWQRRGQDQADRDILVQALRSCKKNMLAHSISNIA